jgi:hypothetical protein
LRLSFALAPLFAAVFVFAPACPSATSAPACNDVTTINFRDRRINVPNHGLIQLRDGQAYCSILPDDKDFADQKEWEITIEDDLCFRPGSGGAVRMIRVNVDHIAGTGAYDYVLIYRCVDGSLHRIFQSQGHLYGTRIKKLSESRFTLSYGVWLERDPNCCPSQQKTDTYVWYETAGTFLRVKSVQGPFNNED